MLEENKEKQTEFQLPLDNTDEFRELLAEQKMKSRKAIQAISEAKVAKSAFWNRVYDFYPELEKEECKFDPDSLKVTLRSTCLGCGDNYSPDNVELHVPQLNILKTILEESGGTPEDMIEEFKKMGMPSSLAEMLLEQLKDDE